MGSIYSAIMVPARHHMACVHEGVHADEWTSGVSLFDMSSGLRLWCTRFTRTPVPIANVIREEVIVAGIDGRLCLLAYVSGSEIPSLIVRDGRPGTRVSTTKLEAWPAELLVVGCGIDLWIVNVIGCPRIITTGSFHYRDCAISHLASAPRGDFVAVCCGGNLSEHRRCTYAGLDVAACNRLRMCRRPR